MFSWKKTEGTRPAGERATAGPEWIRAQMPKSAPKENDAPEPIADQARIDGTPPNLRRSSKPAGISDRQRVWISAIIVAVIISMIVASPYFK
jgi:hypothetical protein